MKHWKLHLIETVMVAVLIVYLYPFVIVVINSAKDSFAVTQFPMRLPEAWSQLFVNMQTIWTSPNIRYSASFFSSVVITAMSLLFVTVFPAMGAWVLVRTKTRTSQVLFLIFVAAMVIPFQIVMFPLVSWFRTVFQITGTPAAAHVLRHRSGVSRVWAVAVGLCVPRVHQKYSL